MWFAAPLVQSGVNVFLAAEKALQDLPLNQSWDNTTVNFEPVGVAGLITPWNALLDEQQAPRGGFQYSGVGREFGTYGIEAFLEPRASLE